jgi:hypothetical protein
MLKNYVLAAFLLLFGVTAIISTEIPKWVVGVVAVAAGLACLSDGAGKPGDGVKKA